MECKQMDKDLVDELNDELCKLNYFLKGAYYSCSDAPLSRGLNHASSLVQGIINKLNGVKEKK